MTAPKARSVLISGASVAGPALAFWLGRFGYDVTVVEKAQSLRQGGYAVDFRGTSMEVLRRMGLLEVVKAEATEMGDMFYVNAKGKPTVRMPSAAFSVGFVPPTGSEDVVAEKSRVAVTARAWNASMRAPPGLMHPNGLNLDPLLSASPALPLALLLGGEPAHE